MNPVRNSLGYKNELFITGISNGMNKNGFSLMELVVAVFIFSVLVAIAGGSFVSALSLQRRALNIKRVEENGRFILELMAREIRVANPINTGNSSCPGSGTSILAFTHPVNGAIEYFLSGSLSGSQVHRRVNGVDSIISNPDVEVSRFIFCISGNTVGDDQQPRVTVVLGLKTPGASVDVTAINLQTTVSQRVLNN